MGEFIIKKLKIDVGIFEKGMCATTTESFFYGIDLNQRVDLIRKSFFYQLKKTHNKAKLYIDNTYRKAFILFLFQIYWINPRHQISIKNK